VPAEEQPPGVISSPLLLPAPPAGPGPLGYLLALAVALLGGVLGILGAFIQEIQTGGLLLLPFLGAPIIEEIAKPCGVYLLLARWPRLLRGQLHTALLAAAAGLSFALVEALVYLEVYFPDAPDWFVTYRLSLPLILHAAASFTVGLGINRGLLDWAARGSPLPRATRNFYLAGIGLHAVFNTTVTALAIGGVFPDV